MNAQSSVWMNFVPLVFLIVIFYLLLIRPQQKQMKERRNMMEALKNGDKVLTTGGIIGVINAIRGDELEMEIAKNVKVTVVKSAVASVLTK
ncbi:MAG: preprotein translocase subunit YajC [Elusimicrobia bacterium]|nr:preprotein translocase subunit YajC [Elusimicrobiota bacterium]